MCCALQSIYPGLFASMTLSHIHIWTREHRVCVCVLPTEPKPNPQVQVQVQLLARLTYGEGSVFSASLLHRPPIVAGLGPEDISPFHLVQPRTPAKVDRVPTAFDPKNKITNSNLHSACPSWPRCLIISPSSPLPLSPGKLSAYQLFPWRSPSVGGCS